MNTIIGLFLVVITPTLGFPSIFIKSNNFANNYLRIDGSSCGTTSTGPGCGEVNAQYYSPGTNPTPGSGKYEIFTLYQNADKNYCIVSQEFPTVRLRMDCSGVTSSSGSGVGSVNAQYYPTNEDCGGYEEFQLKQVGNLYAIESVYFPNCFLRIDGSSCGTTSTGPGCGTVDAQYYNSGTYPGWSGTTGIYELFTIGSSGPICSPWNGKPLSPGNLIALQSQAILNTPTNYELGKYFVVPATYGSNPYNMYTFMANYAGSTPPLSSLFTVDTVSSNSYGMDVTLTNLQTGYQLTADYSVEGYPTQQGGISESPYLLNNFRLAQTVNSNPSGTYTVSPPNVIPQFYGYTEQGQAYYSCDQTTNLWWSCDTYSVALNGLSGYTNNQYATEFSTYTLWNCSDSGIVGLVGEESVSLIVVNPGNGAVIGTSVGAACLALAVLFVVVAVVLVKKKGKKEIEGEHYTLDQSLLE